MLGVNTEMCNEFERPIYESFCVQSNTGSFDEMSQGWRAISNTVSNLTDPRFYRSTNRLYKRIPENLFKSETRIFNVFVCDNCNGNCVLQGALARGQKRNVSVLESSCHLPACLPYTVYTSSWLSSTDTVNTNFYSLWLDLTGNRTQAYRLSSRHSIHSTAVVC